MEDPEEEKLMRKKKKTDRTVEKIYKTALMTEALKTNLRLARRARMTKYVIMNRNLDSKKGVIALETRFHQDIITIIPRNYK